MVFDVHEVEDLLDFEEKKQGEDMIYIVNEKAFLVVHKNTIEVRTDAKLRRVLCEKYESVMESRYFGKGGIEIVMSGQLTDSEVCDLVRLSYDLTKI